MSGTGYGQFNLRDPYPFSVVFKTFEVSTKVTRRLQLVTTTLPGSMSNLWFNSGGLAVSCELNSENCHRCCCFTNYEWKSITVILDCSTVFLEFIPYLCLFKSNGLYWCMLIFFSKVVKICLFLRLVIKVGGNCLLNTRFMSRLGQKI